MAIPKFDDLYIPLIQSLQKLGGSGSTDKMRELKLGVKVATKEVVEVDKEWIKNF